MSKEKIILTSPEIAALWSHYIQFSATTCFYKHFLHHMVDEDIQLLVERTLSFETKKMQEIAAILEEETFPIPHGFTDQDIQLETPRLFSDLFALSFVYRVGQLHVPTLATNLTKVARTDVFQFFLNCQQEATQLYKDAIDLMLKKGIYDRPPKMPYPTKVEYISPEEHFLGSWFGEKRPLHAMELSEIFFAIERNCIGILLMMGLLQVTSDVELKQYFLKGKKLSEKQVEVLNKVLKDEEQIGNIPVSIEVTDSTVPPFSEKLMAFLVTTTTSTGLYLMSYALSMTMRKDLNAKYIALIAEIAEFGLEGFQLLIKRGWMEKPPQPINRKNLYR
ncbi:DUF3231 family protein [Mangrovibacillus cuniculi]|uniref:DUF3231 family protein n=1 Tax=Mangrovibacillus cuniculi TaxID=2593652 RepID=A0A7S8CCH0_9BACI|nr:DUF3231 family protein [Mangrovibacillus cuniculi]QPC47431.1 DUF3231 family protein [Mangrovibacillus cuniculi]